MKIKFKTSGYVWVHPKWRRRRRVQTIYILSGLPLLLLSTSFVSLVFACRQILMIRLSYLKMAGRWPVFPISLFPVHLHIQAFQFYSLW